MEDLPVYLIYEMEALLSVDNVKIIKSLTELKHLDVDNTTYQILVNERKKSLGMGYGTPQYNNGVLCYVLPSIAMGLTVYPDSTSIKAVSMSDYVINYLPFFDKKTVLP